MNEKYCDSYEQLQLQTFFFSVVIVVVFSIKSNLLFVVYLNNQT